MKNKLILAIAVLGIALASCKKVYNYPNTEQTSTNTITDKNLIDHNSVWILVELPPYGDPGVKYFKFESNGKYVVTYNVAEYYWKTDLFFKGSKHSGTFVRSLM